MPQIVKADPWNACASHEVSEFVREAPGLFRLAVLSCANQRLCALPNAKP